jgi:UDP-glucose 6-dehydrogenase
MGNPKKLKLSADERIHLGTGFEVLVTGSVGDEKVAIVNAGESPIKEPGLDELVERAVRKRLLSATKDASGISTVAPWP